MKFKDLTGKKIGKWNVLRRIKVENRSCTLFECQCECGAIKSVLSTHLMRGNTKGCGVCGTLRGNNHPKWNGCGDISANYWCHVKRCAGGKGKRKALEFNISMEYAWNQYLKQNKKCALTNIPLTMNFARKYGAEHTASIDRIDSSKGYVEGNIQWVHKHVNLMKNTLDQDYFISLCKKIASNN